MAPKGRGRGRGNGQQPPQQPGGQQESPPLPLARQQQPPQQGHGPPPGLGQQPQGMAKSKPQRIDPEDIGIQFQQMTVSNPFPKKKEGKLGRPIRLKSNCYALDIPAGNVYHYDIEIGSESPKSAADTDASPDGDKDKKDVKYRVLTSKRNREIVNLMLSTDPQLQNTLAAYDGRKNLYSRHPLKIKGVKKCRVVMEEAQNPDDPRGPRQDVYNVTIKPVNKKDSNDCAISLDPLHELFAGRLTTVPQEAVMAIETVLRHGPCMKYFPVGRSFFYPPHPDSVHPLQGGREIWFGYHQSMRLGQWKPTVNLDITATTFYQSGPLLNYIAEFLKTDVQKLGQIGSLREAEVVRLTREVRNLRIETNHLKNYRRKYKILRLTKEPASKLKFNMTVNGKEVPTTVEDYFAKTYRPLKYPALPCVQGNPEAKKVYLPIEVCDVSEGQHCKKKLEEKQQAEMIKFTARAPKQRFNEIKDILRRANFSQDKYLKEFGIKVASEPLSLDGRVLEAPNVRYDNERKVKPRDGSWDMRDKQYYRGAVINSWVLLSFANKNFCGAQQLNKFAQLLCEIATEQGIGINRPEAIETIDPRRCNIKNILDNCQKKNRADLAVVVVPAANKTIYGEVKQAAETALGLKTQCIKDDSVVKKCNPPLVSNLCQKINAKMGGVNNSLTPGETPVILRRPVIIIGADVTHPAPSHDIKPSIAAAVGSLDAHPSRYAVSLRAQTNMDEKKQSIEEILDLKSMVLELLKAFYRSTNGKKPEKIIFYRDGVSEGQFAKVRDHEVKAIREACKSLNVEYQPGITFVVVQKRHHTRFMPQDERQGTGRMKNVPPGTTVDNTVVHPLNFDFFLCSHFGLQGTSRPCHYTVIEDDNDFTADDLQRLTYYLCHTYVRCTKSISSPAPVMYAHLAAYRARQHLIAQMEESSSGSDTSTSNTAYHPLPESVLNAIRIKDDMINTMYFV